MDFHVIGVLVKPHGLKGEVVMKLEATGLSIIKKFQTVYIEQFSSKIPYVLEYADSLKVDRIRLKLKGVDSSEIAESLRGLMVYQVVELLPKIDVIDFTGYLLLDENGDEIGEVIQVIENPAQDILVVDFDGKEVLIPLTEDLLIGIDQNEELIQMEIPDGLLDL